MDTTSLVVDSVPVSGWRPNVLRSICCVVAFNGAVVGGGMLVVSDHE
jgi:hypothetical protein